MQHHAWLSAVTFTAPTVLNTHSGLGSVAVIIYPDRYNLREGGLILLTVGGYSPSQWALEADAHISSSGEVDRPVLVFSLLSC